VLLKRGSVTSAADLCDRIYGYTLWQTVTDQPFHCSYRPKFWQ
jgi:hypothetical protein